MEMKFAGAALLMGLAAPALLAAQHQHPTPARPDSTRAPTTNAPAPRTAPDTAHQHPSATPDRARSAPPTPAPAPDRRGTPAEAAPSRGVEPRDAANLPGLGRSAADAHAAHGAAGHAAAGHEMFSTRVGGWNLMGMGQVYALGTRGAPGLDASPLTETEAYLTQPVAMVNVESPGQAFTLRTTLDFEALTMPDGELTFGGWGEGFIDKRHPHTLVHELMLSANLWNAAGGSLSLSAGKGFAPFGTDDPMSRPPAKYPTNHHLSQVLERWTLNAVYLRGPWSVEAGLFAGAEPEGPYDMSNYHDFADSWSARVVRRFGGTGTRAHFELSGSYALISERHGDEHEHTSLANAYFRHQGGHGRFTLYNLVEASRSEPHGDHQGYYSLLGETLATVGRHAPYARIEFSTRPEFARESPTGGEGFFRYDHDAEAIGATRWVITTLGYGLRTSRFPAGSLPFVEVQHHRVRGERGAVDPALLFGDDSFWSLTAGVRLFLGSSGPMRMGSYGVLDDMTWMHRMAQGAIPASYGKR
ncbi:MAG TPA: hypothetical protein VNP72_03555 [Longimicrobium sp.]|nr:hypothetical protein [Longimicrobium sp.]